MHQLVKDFDKRFVLHYLFDVSCLVPSHFLRIRMCYTMDFIAFRTQTLMIQYVLMMGKEVVYFDFRSLTGRIKLVFTIIKEVSLGKNILGIVVRLRKGKA